MRQLEVQERTALWLFRLADQAEVRLLRRPAPLADVATDAGANDVVPGALAPLAPRRDVVETQFRGRGSPAAVLALVIVPRETVAAIEFDRVLGHFLVREQTNDPWHLDLAAGRAHPVVVLE